MDENSYAGQKKKEKTINPGLRPQVFESEKAYEREKALGMKLYIYSFSVGQLCWTELIHKATYQDRLSSILKRIYLFQIIAQILSQAFTKLIVELDFKIIIAAKCGVEIWIARLISWNT